MNYLNQFMTVVYNKDFILDNIKEVVEQATSFHFIEAKEWYPKAHDECKNYSQNYDIDFQVVAGICSSLSPLKGWHQNLILTKDFLKGKRWGHFTKQIKKAEKLLTLDNIKSLDTQIETIKFVLGGNKTINFFQHIYNPMDNTAMVIDTHMLNICYGGMIKSVTNKQYDFLKNILIEQAKLCNLASSEYQSLLWLMMKYVKKK